MCGIAGIHRRTSKPVPRLNRLMDELLLANEHRGPHATGWMAVLDSGKTQMEKAPRRATAFVRDRKRASRAARTVMLHNRFATIGAKHDPRNAHPVASGHVAAVHNGTIYNHAELFATFGLKRTASVDSEIIPALVSKAGWDQAEHALALMDGGAACAIVDVRRPQELILARLRDYPLVYMVTKDMLVWASTEDAIRRAWYKTYGKPTPRGARIYHVREYRLLRVNGKVEGYDIDVPRKRPVKTKPTISAKGKRRRARKQRNRTTQDAALAQLRIAVSAVETRPLNLATATPPTEPGMTWDEHDLLCETEPWQEDIVRQIMRIEGLNEDEARELVFG